LRLAAEHKLDQAQMRLFHPIGFMLASPAQDAEEALSYFARAAVEDKYDGIRAQVHVGGKEDPRVRLFSRTLDEISPAFPELAPALRAFPDPLILDGEILAWSPDTAQALPFAELQKRLGRKRFLKKCCERCQWFTWRLTFYMRAASCSSKNHCRNDERFLSSLLLPSRKWVYRGAQHGHRKPAGEAGL